MVFHGKWYDEVNVGESFGTSVTVTETHIVLGSGMFGDFNPLHVDEEFSKKSMFGGRILQLAGQATNQRNELAVECEGKILVASKAS